MLIAEVYHAKVCVEIEIREMIVRWDIDRDSYNSCSRFDF